MNVEALPLEKVAELAESAPEVEKKRPKPKPKGPKYQGVSVGRIVHVVADQYLASVLAAMFGQHLAAIVTDVGTEGRISTTVFSPVGNQPKHGAVIWFDDDATPCTWHWPEREAE